MRHPQFVSVIWLLFVLPISQEELGQDIIDTTDFNIIFFAPLVTESELADWEEYSTEGQKRDSLITQVNEKVVTTEYDYESSAHR